MIYIAVVGGASCSAAEAAIAREVGRETAARGAVLVCGGGSGVMEAAAQGAVETGGVALGLLPGSDHRSGNKHLSLAIATGLGEARNALITRTADALIAVGGEYGTLSEIALALKMGKPVVGIGSWAIRPPRPLEGGIIPARTAAEAAETAFQLAGEPGG